MWSADSRWRNTSYPKSSQTVTLKPCGCIKNLALVSDLCQRSLTNVITSYTHLLIALNEKFVTNRD